jgi:hypothetical protein
MWNETDTQVRTPYAATLGLSASKCVSQGTRSFIHVSTHKEINGSGNTFRIAKAGTLCKRLYCVHVTHRPAPHNSRA